METTKMLWSFAWISISLVTPTIDFALNSSTEAFGTYAGVKRTFFSYCSLPTDHHFSPLCVILQTCEA